MERLPVDSLMSSDGLALVVRDVSKIYRVYGRPHRRVLQMFADRFNLRRSFGFEVPAVNGVSFELGQGESVAIIGRNGSGKSTLLEMIAGTLSPTSGEIARFGRISALLELGAGFNPDFTGRQNYRINAAILGLTEQQLRETEPKVEAFAEIGEFIDEPVRTYSSGMYVRLAFATAVHVIPDLLVVDEALAVGDVFFQQKCFDYLTNELAEASKVIVTHDLASAIRLTDRCIVMEKGKIVFDGPPLEAVETYTALALSGRAPTGSEAANSHAPVGERPEVPEVESIPAEQTKLAGTYIPEHGRSSNPAGMHICRWQAFKERRGVSSTITSDAPVVVPADRVVLQFEIELGVDVPEPVWGYLFRDRVGNAVFGQNTLGSGITVSHMGPGRYAIEMQFDWPEVEPGDYVLTLGLGDGRHPLHHRIVSWVQSVAKFTSAPQRDVHGSFNNDLIIFHAKPL
jgi:ABC-type polysaccharide/polyol phosphate transport system ATPase subunit